MEPRVFNWSDGVLHSMKKHLTKCKKGDLKQFGYESILVSFFLERVPNLRLQVEWSISAPQDPRMKRWCDLMAQHVVGPIVKYNDLFLNWLRPQLLMVDDYAYFDLGFRGDPTWFYLKAFSGGTWVRSTFCFYNVFVNFEI
jgi:hypothetical protein